MMQPELKQRVLSGTLLGIAVLLLIWWGGAPFRIFCALLALLIHLEWTTMVDAARRSWPAYVAGWIAMAVVAFCIVFGAGLAGTLATLLGAMLVAMLARASGRGVWFSLGVLYACFSGLALAELRDDGTSGLIAATFLFAVVWATDIFAYFCGRALGGRKLAPRISPGKTWSGAIFGALAGMAAGTVIGLLAMQPGGVWIPLLALLISVSSQLGDLFESWMKRRYAIKDSGRLIPGHGGVMDRVDGLVFAAFAACLIAFVVSTGNPASEAGLPIAARLFGL